jgi:competence protein ComFB
MAAMALNTVKPLYRFSFLGVLYAAQAMADEAYAASVREAAFMESKGPRMNAYFREL